MKMSKEYNLDLNKQELYFLLSATRNYRGQIHKLRLPAFSIDTLNTLIEKAEKIFFEIQDTEQCVKDLKQEGEESNV